MNFLCRALDLVTRPSAMAAAIGLSILWALQENTLASWLDALLSGGALVMGQAIYREAAPRDDALHQKLDGIIDGTAADNRLQGLEKAGAAAQQGVKG